MTTGIPHGPVSQTPQHPPAGMPFPAYVGGPGMPYPSQDQQQLGWERPPGIGPVIVFTALFGFFGAISAARRSARARALGAPGQRYWIAFAGTLAGCWVLGLTLAVVMLSAFSSVSSASTLEREIVTNGDFTDGTDKATPKAATCAALQVDSDGAGTYRCMVDFAEGVRTSYEVTVSPDGTWVTDSGN